MSLFPSQLTTPKKSPAFSNLFMNLFKKGKINDLSPSAENDEVYFPVLEVVFSIRLSHGPLARNFPSKASFPISPFLHLAHPPAIETTMKHRILNTNQSLPN